MKILRLIRQATPESRNSNCPDRFIVMVDLGEEKSVIEFEFLTISEADMFEALIEEAKITVIV